MGPHGVLIIDGEGRVARMNGPARELLGDCVGRPCRDSVRVQDRLRGNGCKIGCAEQLATSNSETRCSVGVVQGRPWRVSCAGMGGEVVVTITPVSELPERPERLTTREVEVLSLVAIGLSGTRIAKRLGISAATVRTHVEHVRDKLGARTRAEAVARATALGLV